MPSGRAHEVFGTRKRNLLGELPYHELKDNVMHNRDGSFELGFAVTLPHTTFHENFNALVGGLKSALEGPLREGMRLRFGIEGGRADRASLTRVKKRITAPEKMLRYLLNERHAMLEDDWYRGSLLSYRVTCQVRVPRKAKKFFILSRRRAAERKALCDEVRSQLMAAFSAAGYAATPMANQDIFELVYRYMNPGQSDFELGDYTPTWHRYSQKTIKKIPGTVSPTLRAQVAESKIDNRQPGYLTVGDHYVKMIALNKLPDGKTVVTMMQDALAGGEKFFVAIDLYHQPYHEGAMRTKARARRFEAAASQTDFHVDAETRHMAEQARKLSDRLAGSSEHLFLASVGFVLFDKNLRSLDERIEKLYTSLQRVPGRPFRVLAQGLFTPFIQFAPFSGLDYSEKVTLTSLNAAHFIPVAGPWTGATEPVAVYRNRYYGMTNIDPFDGVNYNGIVVGRSGSGKTFSMNHMLSEFLADQTNQVVVIDRGGGYEPLVEAGEGVSIKLSPGGGSRINPFDITPGATVPTDLEKDNLLKLIRAMIPGEAGAKQEVEDAVLMAAIEQVYSGAKRFDRERQEEVFVPPTMTDFIKKLRSIDEVGEVRAEEDVKKDSRDLALRLQSWTGQTPKGKFVDGQTSVPIADARVVYYDTEGLANAGQLSIVGTLLIANLVWQRVKQRRGQKSLVVLDEGWAMLKESAVARSFVEEMYRRLRREGAGIWSISQSLADFADLQGIIGNAEKFISFGVNQTERNLWTRVLQLPERTLDFFADLKQIKGNFSEAMCLFRRDGRWEGGIIAIHPTKADYWAFTTNDDDMALRDEKASELGGTFSAVQHLSERPAAYAAAA